MMIHFLFQAGPLSLCPFGRPRDAFRGQDPGSQLALGVDKVPNLSPAWEQNFPGTAPLLWLRTSYPPSSFGGVEEGGVATWCVSTPYRASGRSFAWRQEGLDKAALESGSRLNR